KESSKFSNVLKHVDEKRIFLVFIWFRSSFPWVAFCPQPSRSFTQLSEGFWDSLFPSSSPDSCFGHASGSYQNKIGFTN
ncbi:hypothetical protein CEXT_73091, partial [Caerostris extrusa]